jgi:hypothetical protein
MSKQEELQAEVLALRKRVTELEQELVFLRTHPTLLQGLRGETLVAQLAGGTLTKYAETYDVKLGNSVRVEVKFSELHRPDRQAATRRWNWSKPFGWQDKGKDFDFLVLIGAKDRRFPEQYKDDSPYVFFLIPRTRVQEVVTRGGTIGSSIQMTTNLSRALSPASMALKNFMVPMEEVRPLLNGKVSE